MIPLLAIAATVLLAATLLFAGLWLRNRRRAARAEAEAVTARQRVERAEDAKEKFFDLVTHELRSPLSAILGYHELLQDGAYGALPDAAAEPLGRIGRSGRHLLHLIDGVVELSRIRSGTVRAELGDVNLSVVFAAIADAFRVTAHERTIEPRVHMPDSLPTIRSDQNRIVRALDLVVTSAVKHPTGSEITLSMTTDAHGASVRVTGTEIPISANVDDPALRLGLRLAVADAIAGVLGGTLDLETDDDGVISALAFRIPDLSSPPLSHPPPNPSAGPTPNPSPGL